MKSVDASEFKIVLMFLMIEMQSLNLLGNSLDHEMENLYASIPIFFIIPTSPYD